MKKSELNSRLSDNMFQNESQDLVPKIPKKNIIYIVMIILFLAILGTLLALFIISNKNDKKESQYNPVPKNEDLEFTEEEHRILARKVAAQLWY